MLSLISRQGLSIRRILARRFSIVPIFAINRVRKITAVLSCVRNPADSSAPILGARNIVLHLVHRVKSLVPGESPFKSFLFVNLTSGVSTTLRNCPHFNCPVPCGSVSFKMLNMMRFKPI